jgi:hypothetical protein
MVNVGSKQQSTPFDFHCTERQDPPICVDFGTVLRRDEARVYRVRNNLRKKPTKSLRSVSIIDLDWSQQAQHDFSDRL